MALLKFVEIALAQIHFLFSVAADLMVTQTVANLETLSLHLVRAYNALRLI